MMIAQYQPYTFIPSSCSRIAQDFFRGLNNLDPLSPAGITKPHGGGSEDEEVRTVVTPLMVVEEMVITRPPAFLRWTIVTDMVGTIITLSPITRFVQSAVVHTIGVYPIVVRAQYLIPTPRLHILPRVATQMETTWGMVDIALVLRLDGVMVTEVTDPTVIRQEWREEVIAIATLIRARIEGEGDVEDGL